MSFSGSSGPHLIGKQPISVEYSPKMLKDFLREDPNSHKASRLLKRQLKTASMAVSALGAVAKAVRAIPRTLSKQQSPEGIKNPKKTEEFATREAAVRIKDIIRWRSFQDVAEEEARMLKFRPLATTASSLSTSSSSSWCDSDFSSDSSPSWRSNRCEFYDNRVTLREKFWFYASLCRPSWTIGNSREESKKLLSHGRWVQERKSPEKGSERHSPVSVINFEIGEDGEWCWSSKESPAHDDIIGEHEEEEEEEEADDHDQEEEQEEEPSRNCSISCSCSEERVLVDFFRSELTQVWTMSKSDYEWGSKFEEDKEEMVF